MKLYLKQRYSEEVFESILAKGTTKAERWALKILKNDLFEEDGFFNPALLGENLCVKYAKALGYNIPEDYDFDPNHGGLSWWEDHPEFPGWQYFNCIPSNIEVLEAFYKMTGRYRKLRRLHKEVERIEKIRHFRHERVYNELSKQRQEAWEEQQEAV
jgi:hypothetical protein